jgi:hypothetical protein
MKPVGLVHKFHFLSKIQHRTMYTLGAMNETLELSESGNSVDLVNLFILYPKF